MSTSPWRFLNDWYGTVSGVRFRRELAQCLSPVLESRFGYYAVQIGGEVLGHELLNLTRINDRTLLGRESPSDIICEYEALPVAPDSIDLVLLPHTLERSADPRALLREVERVLVADGHVIVVGMDPWTLWGAARWLGAGSGAGGLSQRRVRDWLDVLGLEVDRADSLPMVHFQRGNLAAFWPKVERIISLVAAHVQGSYVLVARKRLMKMTPLPARWRSRSTTVHGGLAKPAARGIKRVGD